MSPVRLHHSFKRWLLPSATFRASPYYRLPLHIQDDPEPLRPSLPPTPVSTGSNDEQTPSSSDSCDSDSDSDSDSDDSDREERAIKSPTSDSYQLVSHSDHDDHIDYRRIETLSFDETIPKYHSKRSSATYAQLIFHPSLT
ncbi:hypothetical protein J3E74DRAFT_423612 [Bipolaris maydis]|nr:hypothetical protein J3E74DRAFT_423612 [Bipolaris maydis]